MNFTSQIAKLFRDVHFGGNWTSVNLKETLAGVGWQQATTKVHSLNTIVHLVYHINYYVGAVVKVLQGGPLDAHDKYSFDLPSIQSQEDWQKLLDKTFAGAESFADSILLENFNDGKYGNYYRNIHGIIEHTHYHLGQIVLIKKILVLNNGSGEAGA